MTTESPPTHRDDTSMDGTFLLSSLKVTHELSDSSASGIIHLGDASSLQLSLFQAESPQSYSQSVLPDKTIVTSVVLSTSLTTTTTSLSGGNSTNNRNRRKQAQPRALKSKFFYCQGVCSQVSFCCLLSQRKKNWLSPLSVFACTWLFLLFFTIQLHV